MSISPSGCLRASTRSSRPSGARHPLSAIQSVWQLQPRRIRPLRPVCHQSGIPGGRADAFPVELVEPEAAEPVAPAVEPTVVLGVFVSGVFSDGSVGLFSRTRLLLTSQHCLDVTP